MKKGIFYLLCVGILLTVPACSVREKNKEKIRNLNFRVLQEEEIPEELKEQMDAERMEAYRITYTDQGKLYIARGYGEKETNGYRVDVTECYETENTICIHTELLGPEKGEKIQRRKTNPHVVVSLSAVEKSVIFN